MRLVLSPIVLLTMLIAVSSAQENQQSQQQETTAQAAATVQQAMTGSVQANPTVNVDPRIENQSDALAVLVKEGDQINPSSSVVITSPEPKVYGPMVPSVQPAWQVPGSQLPNNFSAVRESMVRVHQGWCRLEDVPLFSQWMRYFVKTRTVKVPYSDVASSKLMGFDYNLRPILVSSSRSGGIKHPYLANSSRFEKIRGFSVIIHLREDCLSRPLEDDRTAWIEVQNNLDFSILFESYDYIGNIVVVGSTEHNGDQVMDILKGLILISNIEVAFVTNSSHLRNATIGVQPGGGMNIASVDIGLTGVLSGIFTDAKMKGKPWATGYCFIKRPPSEVQAWPPPELVSAYVTNGLKTNSNYSQEQEQPSPAVLKE